MTLPEDVDLLVLDTAPLELAGRVALHGRLLFEADPAARVAWEAASRKIYLDDLLQDAARLGHVKYLFVTLLEGWPG